MKSSQQGVFGDPQFARGRFIDAVIASPTVAQPETWVTVQTGEMGVTLGSAELRLPSASEGLMTRVKPKQRILEFRSWGGARKGAGRKRTSSRKCVPHRKRIVLKSYQPQHTTLRLVDEVASVRRWRVFAEIVSAIHASERVGFRVVEFSVQDGHLDLVTEAGSARALSNGVRALSIRIARALNRVLGRCGKVFADRFHTRALSSLREVKNALVYVLQNARKHFEQKGVALRADWLDRFSSAGFFDGWSSSAAKEAVAVREAWRAAGLHDSKPTRDAATWLLRVGWRRLGLIKATDVPAT